jgi:hypothetical protein
MTEGSFRCELKCDCERERTAWTALITAINNDYNPNIMAEFDKHYSRRETK